MKFLEGYEKYSGFVLRIALGFIFLYFGVWKFFNPEFWATYLNPYLVNILPFSTTSLMYVIGAVETVVGILLVIGLFTQVAAFIAFLNLLGIIVTSGWNDTVIRDIGLLAMSFALSVRPRCRFAADNLRKK